MDVVWAKVGGEGDWPHHTRSTTCCVFSPRRLRKRATAVLSDDSHVLVADKSGEVKRCAVHAHEEMQSAPEYTSAGTS